MQTPLSTWALGLKPTTGATRIALQVRDKAIQSVIGFVATTPVAARTWWASRSLEVGQGKAWRGEANGGCWGRGQRLCVRPVVGRVLLCTGLPSTWPASLEYRPASLVKAWLSLTQAHAIPSPTINAPVAVAGNSNAVQTVTLKLPRHSMLMAHSPYPDQPRPPSLPRWASCAAPERNSRWQSPNTVAAKHQPPSACPGLTPSNWRIAHGVSRAEVADKRGGPFVMSVGARRPVTGQSSLSPLPRLHGSLGQLGVTLPCGMH
ncbi:hypothetical protein B0T16DRAFT_536 [Cercophora newfieldiana]|uniref:Uncharacterized protein n=1 Tax=Cercophora newfieldiana TaxID=92897 RepID=A0AA39YMT7_9PEZI|nr:hypothetical protein B0T16DRAFT_536 [Cercophora newfieldiana]